MTRVLVEEVEAASASAEQAADLAALQAMAGAEPVPVDPNAPPPPAPVDLAGELAGLVTMVVGILGPAFPSLTRIYTEQTIATAAGAVAAVCNKHGWMQGGLMGEWGEEIACAVVVVPLAIATAQGVRADIEARKPAKPEQAQAQAATLASPTAAAGGYDSKTVSIGAVTLPAGGNG